MSTLTVSAVAYPSRAFHCRRVRRATVIDQLRPIEQRLRARGVRALYLFGSVARDEAEPGSDVDLLFDHDPASGFSLFTQAELSEELSERMGTRVDLIALDGLRASFRSRVAGDLIRVF